MTWSAIAICKCHWVARWISFSHTIASHTEELAGSMDNLRLPIVGVWRKATIVDEGREDALGCCLASWAICAISDQSRTDTSKRERDACMAGPGKSWWGTSYLIPPNATHLVLPPKQKYGLSFFFTNLLLHEPILISWKENEKQQYQSEAGYSEYTE